jgi:hypothetical protein
VHDLEKALEQDTQEAEPFREAGPYQEVDPCQEAYPYQEAEPYQEAYPYQEAEPFQEVEPYQEVEPFQQAYPSGCSFVQNTAYREEETLPADQGAAKVHGHLPAMFHMAYNLRRVPEVVVGAAVLTWST